MINNIMVPWLMLSYDSIDQLLSLSFKLVFLREIKIKISEKDYLDFLKASNGYNLTIEEKILEIINYYVIIERKRLKLEKMKIRFKPLNSS